MQSQLLQRNICDCYEMSMLQAGTISKRRFNTSYSPLAFELDNPTQCRVFNHFGLKAPIEHSHEGLAQNAPAANGIGINRRAMRRLQVDAPSRLSENQAELISLGQVIHISRLTLPQSLLNPPVGQHVGMFIAGIPVVSTHPAPINLVS